DDRREPRLPLRVRTCRRRVDVCNHMRAAPDRLADAGRIRAAARPRHLERHEGRAAGRLRRSAGGASLRARCLDRHRASGRADRRPVDDASGGAVRAVARLAARACDAMLYLTIIGDAFIDALSERARAGVRVTIVMDAIGSFGAFRRSSRPLEAAGCRVAAYQRFTWYRLSRLNNRTHRELLVVDGTVAFVGGAGVADWWSKRHRGKPMWRDMMARIEGPVVAQIQGVVAENWMECCGEILTGPNTYKPRV